MPKPRQLHPGRRIATAASSTRTGGVRHTGGGSLGAALALRSYQLENGLSLLVGVDATAPVVSYMTWLDVGSRHERPGKTGLAHLFEHLMFAGTEAHPPGTFDQLIEAAGAESNAATWVDFTQYYENLPADRLELAIELEADRLAHLRLDDDVVRTEKDVVANERKFRVDDDVDGAVAEALYRTAFKVHTYGHPTIGYADDIAGFTTADCVAFHRANYVPRRVTLVVVGDVDEADVVRKVARAYGRIPSPRAGRAGRGEPSAEPAQRSERRVVLEKATDAAKVVHGYKAPALTAPDSAALSIANEILFGGRSSRVHRALVHDQELAVDVSASLSPFRDPGLYEMWLTARPSVPTARLEAALAKVLARALDRGFTDDELERAKNRSELTLLQGLETASGKAENVGFHAVVSRDPYRVGRALEAYRAVDRDAARAALARVVRDAGRTVVEVRPTGHA